MPIYEYECTTCYHQFDLMQKFSDEPVSQCPQCSSNTAKRLVSAAGFQLKGTGWYATDFKNKPETQKQERTTTEKDKKATDTKSTSTKGDSE